MDTEYMFNLYTNTYLTETLIIMSIEIHSVSMNQQIIKLHENLLIRVRRIVYCIQARRLYYIQINNLQ